MNKQRKLTRPSKGLTFKVRIGNNAVFLRTGEYPDGTLGEIFIDMYKEGAGYKAILGNFSILTSWLLQYGVPLERLVEKFQFTRFEPAGPVVGDNEIKMCSSILDYVFRRLAITYLDRKDLGNVKSELPDFIDDEVYLDKPTLKIALFEAPKEKLGNKPDIQIYTFGSGSVGYRPVGYKSEEFFKYCKKNAGSHPEYGTLDFDEGGKGIAAFTLSDREWVVKILKQHFFDFYGKKLDLGDA